MATKTSKKNKGTAPAASAPAAVSESRKATVHEVHAQAELLLESAAIIRAVADEVVPRFYPQPLRAHPELLLRRRGSGARPAQVDGIVNAEIAIREAARTIEEHGRALLEAVIDLAGLPAPEVVEVRQVDEVVRLEEVQNEYACGTSSPK